MDMHVFISQTIMNIDGMIWTFYAKKICEHLWTFDLCLFRKFACKECVVSYLVLLHLCQCFVEVTTPKLERVESLV